MGAIHFSLDRKLAEFLVREFGARALVETGTFEGETACSLHDLFDRIFTVEQSPECYRRAVEKLNKLPNVQCRLGSSENELKSLPPEFRNAPTFFWLDAHWCAGEGVEAVANPCPLLAEIDALGMLSDNEAILIDDARFFLCPPVSPHSRNGWPGISDIIDRLPHVAPGHRLLVIDDVLSIHPARWHESLSDFAHQHAIDLLDMACAARRAAHIPELRAVIEEKEAVIHRQHAEIMELHASVRREFLKAESLKAKLQVSQ